MPLRKPKTLILPDAPIDSSGSWPIGSRQPTPPRVLLADDEPQLLRMLARVLRAAGFEVEAVPTANEALELISAIGFDVVVTDLFMPELCGARVLAAVRELDRSLPVVVITGAGDLRGAFTELEDSALHFISKPFLPQDLCLLVESLAETARLAMPA